MDRFATTLMCLLFAFAGSAIAQVEHPPSGTSVAFDAALGQLSQAANGLASGELGNSIGLAGDAVTGFAGAALTDTTDSINPAGGLDFLGELRDFGTGTQGPDATDPGEMPTLPGL